MKPLVTWVLISDLESARILEHADGEDALVQRANHVFKAPAVLAYSDDEGRAMAGTTSARVRLDRHVEYTPESEAFTKQLLGVLTQGLRENAFDRLIICAGPSMLGLLRARMPSELGKTIRAEIAKDLVNIPNTKLNKHLSGVIRFK